MYYGKLHKDLPDVILSNVSAGSTFKLNLASNHIYVVVDSAIGLVSEVSTGLMRRFPPYWWVYIFY